MALISDKKLNALIDGELNDSETVEIEKVVSQDGKSAARLAQLSAVDGLIREAVTRLDKSAETRPEPIVGGSGISAQPTVNRPSGAANDNWWRLPLAASIALVVGLFSGSALLAPAGDQPELLQLASYGSGSSMHEFLETSYSGQSVNLDHAEGEIRLSFSGTDGNPCREFVLQGSQSSTQALACKKPSGEWAVQLAARVDTIAKHPADQGYQTAAVSDEAFGLAVAAVMQSDAFDTETEKVMIKNEWQE